MLSNLCQAIFLDPRRSLPREFTSRALPMVSSALRVLDAVAERAGIRRGTAPVSNRYEPIFVPEAARLKKLKNAVTFTNDELGSLLAAADLPRASLEPLIIAAGEAALADYDVANGPVLWRPFVDCNRKLIVVIPGMVVSAIRQELLRLAYELNVQSTLAENYNKTVWRNVEQSLSFTKNVPFPHRPPNRLNLPCASDGFFSLDHDKALYCLLVSDPLTRPATTDPFGVWMDDALSHAVNQRISQVEADVLASSPAPNDLFVVVALQGLGGSAALGFERTPADCPSIALAGDALRVISLLEGGDPMALFNFARARDDARKKCRITTADILDEFYLYRKNEYSFYFSDQVPPDIIFIPPGDSLNLEMEIARERDFHAGRTANGASVEVTALHGTVAIPIYSPVSDLGERVRLLVEGLPVPIWITGPENDATAGDHKIHALFADAISFWIWQFTPLLAPMLSELVNKQSIEIQMQLPGQEVWHTKEHGNAAEDGSRITTTPDIAHHRLEVRVHPAAISLFQTADNRGERELMRSILPAISQLLPRESPRALTSAALDTAIEKIAPLGMKKMLLLFDSTRTPEISDRGIPRYRPLQKVWVNGQLDRVGRYLVENIGLGVGPVDRQQRTQVLNKVVLYCFSQIQRIIATITPDELLPFLVAYSESVHREQALNRLTIPTRLECFRSDRDMISQMVQSIPELANVGLASRFLVEYAVAQPPIGLRPISLDLYDELRAWSHHCLNYAMLSDAIHSGIEEYALSLLASQRLGIDGSPTQNALSGHMRAFALDQIGAAPEHFKRQWEFTTTTTRGEKFQLELDAATVEEFGVPLSQLLELMEFGISRGLQTPDGPVNVSEAIFVQQAAAATKRGQDQVRAALELLTLGPRPSFDTPPAGYSKTDLYPWRYNRPLSYLRRPFLRQVRNGVPEIVYGFRHLRASQRFLVDQCTSGKIKAKTGRMRSFMNRVLSGQGDVFNDRVSGFFDSVAVLSVKSRVKKIGHLRELQDHLGDIDVLLGDPARKRILVIECKDLSAARTPYEMANEYTELFVGNRGNKSIVDKHLARTAWVKSNADAVAAFLQLDVAVRWKIIPLIVVDQPLMASYIRESPIQVLSFEEIRHFWPELRRI